jgi:hypothetical protein
MKDTSTKGHQRPKFCFLTETTPDIDQWHKITEQLGTPEEVFFEKLQPTVGRIHSEITSNEASQSFNDLHYQNL